MTQRATHTNYLHLRHLRVEEAGEVFCVSPSYSKYEQLVKKSLPDWLQLTPGEIAKLPRHSSTFTRCLEGSSQ